MDVIGLDGLEVPQKSSDGGVDLKGLKRWFDGLMDHGSVKYYEQSKRYRPGSSVSIESIRALKGFFRMDIRVFYCMRKGGYDGFKNSP